MSEFAVGGGVGEGGGWGKAAGVGEAEGGGGPAGERAGDWPRSPVAAEQQNVAMRRVKASRDIGGVRR